MSSQELSRAAVDVQVATRAAGESGAVYEVTLARLYLDKAREEWGYNRYRTSLAYARSARQHAREAEERVRQADGRRRGGR